MLKALQTALKEGWYDISKTERGKAKNATRYAHYGSHKPPSIPGHQARYWQNNKWHKDKPENE